MVHIVKVVLVFSLVLVLIRLSVQVGLALAAGAVALGITYLMSPMKMAGVALSAITNEKTLLITSVVMLILILSSSMEQLGQLDELLGRFAAFTGGSRLSIVTFPALIGLLPMPGGAVFSAPMLDAMDKEKHLEPSLKSFLNFWYRHIWEYWWPLYPGVILTCSIAELKLWHYVILMLPLSPVAAAAGLPSLLRLPPHLRGSHSSQGCKPHPRRGIFKTAMPLILAIVPGLAFGAIPETKLFGASIPHIPKEVGLIAGLIAAVIWSWGVGRVRWQQIKEILWNERLGRMFITIAGIFVFKGMLEASGAATQMGDALLNWAIPLFLVAIVLPMAIGAISGISIAFVGTTFPILVTLIHAMGMDHVKSPLVMLAFASGYMGVLMTPVHLCLILSNEYFGASWAGVYKRLWISGLITFSCAIVYFFLLKAGAPPLASSP